MQKRQQQTLREEASFSGIGLHTGQQVSMKFIPAKEDTGILFRRSDLPHSPVIPALVEQVLDTSRSTILGTPQIRIQTVEHVLAALKAFQIDNLIIEIDNLEPPIGHGSSDVFVDMIEGAGIIPQNGVRAVHYLKHPVFYSEKDIHLIALPCEETKFSYTVHYPDVPAIKSQYFSFTLSPMAFKEQVSSCRTFCLYREVEHLMERGLIKGASLDNAVVIKDEIVFSKNGLFFQDEMARHKTLDLIGDLSLIGPVDVIAHFISIKSGHATNCSFAKKIVNQLSVEKTS
jgi:UDP-3-O-[3-hydroxymyristoyl] N-acetylglucosamine deacetylase